MQLIPHIIAGIPATTPSQHLLKLTAHWYQSLRIIILFFYYRQETRFLISAYRTSCLFRSALMLLYALKHFPCCTPFYSVCLRPSRLWLYYIILF